MWTFQMLTHFIIQYQKFTFTNITTDLIREVFEYWETATLTVADRVFQNFIFLLESLTFVTGCRRISQPQHCCCWGPENSLS